MKNAIGVIRKWWGVKSYAEIGEITGQTANAVRLMGLRAGLPALCKNKQEKQCQTNLSPEESVQRDVVLGNLSAEAKKTQKKYELVAKELEEANAMIDAFKHVKASNFYQIKNNPSGVGNEATAVAVLSDVHFAEVVRSENVNDKNEYNIKIARARVEKFFTSVVKLVKIFKKESQIHTLILALLGDLINGQLREEAMENNSLQPMVPCAQKSWSVNGPP